MSRAGRAFALALLFGVACAGQGWALEPAALLEGVRSTRLDPERAVRVRNIDIEIGLALLRIESAILIPTQPVDGRIVEVVLIGQAHFGIEPPDEIEAGQLELFTGSRVLQTPVEQAVLVIADQPTMRRLLDRPPARPPSPSTLERAQGIHQRWLENTERRSTGVESGIFKFLVGDRAFRGYFAAWCSSHESGDFVYTFDPEDAEQLTLAAFDPIDVRGWDRLRLARHIRMQQRKGRFLGVRVQDLGAWDIWLSSRWSDDSIANPGSVGFETQHYDLDVTIKRRTLKLEATATLHLAATAPGRRTVSLELFRDLQVQRVVDDTGRELFHFRSGPEVVVVLPESPGVGDRLTLEVVYGGSALKWAGRRTYDLESTHNWYPHCGSVDRATYNVILRWPVKYQLLAGGRFLARGQHGKYRWERRSIDVPAIAFSFVLGKFELTQRKIGHVRLTLGISRAGGKPEPADSERVVEVVARALEFFENAFGRYPLDELTVVVLPRRFSQSYLGYVTLSDSVLKAEQVRPQSAGEWIRETTIAHEIAHQWWGNLIGWWSYRDQWLSEAMANYAGLLFYARSEAARGASLADMSAGWRASLEQTVESGRTVESLGPIVLGNRLNSSEASNGYRAIVYRKGAVVLAMLARAVGEDAFLGMLRSLVEAASNRVITTESFLEAMERMSGLELQGFAAQYIYGTGIPLVYYDYQIERSAEGDGWVVTGEARRLRDPHYTLRLEPGAGGVWELVRETDHGEAGASTVLMVPFRLTSTETEPDTESAHGAGHRTVQTGQLMLHGAAERFEIKTDFEPFDLTLDPQGEILAHFYSVDTSPKRFARYRALDLIVEGRTAAAERELLRALDAPLGEPPDTPQLPWLRDDETESLRENAAIRLTLARLYLEQQRDRIAAEQLRRVDELFEDRQASFRLERDTLWARLELRRGESARAYRRLKRALRLAGPRRGARDLRQHVLLLQLQSERMAMTGAYALLAAAAYETGNLDDYEWAVAAARERGADVVALERVSSTPPPDLSDLE